LRTAPAPFGELAWQHARTVLAQRGRDEATEAEIAQAAAALLDRAEQGPAAGATSKRDLRVAGRTRATNIPTDPRPPTAPEDDRDAPPPDQPNEPERADESAKVIPLPVFDARKEAEQWRF